MEQRDNQLLGGAPQDQAPKRPANASEQPRDQGHGQSSASDAGLREGDTMTSQDRSPNESTSAQRAGGQSQGGQGMGNESFKGSSLGGQVSSAASGAPLGRGQAGKSSENDIDPTTGQPNEEGFARDGQGAVDPVMPSGEAARDPAKPSCLDGE